MSTFTAAQQEILRAWGLDPARVEAAMSLTPKDAKIMVEDTDLSWRACVTQEGFDALKAIASFHKDET